MSRVKNFYHDEICNRCPTCGVGLSEDDTVPCDAPGCPIPCALDTLATDLASTIALASRSIPHVDRIDRRRLVIARDKLGRYHAALVLDIDREIGGPFSTLGCWQTREPGIRDIIRDVERIANSANVRRAA